MEKVTTHKVALAFALILWGINVYWGNDIVDYIAGFWAVLAGLTLFFEEQ